MSSQPKVKVKIKNKTKTKIKQRNKPIYFWREHSHPHDYLSQWYPSPFTAPSPFPSPSSQSSSSPPPTNSIKFHTAEQYMMYHKALLFADPITATAILSTPDHHPRTHQKLGRSIRAFSSAKWDAAKESIVEQGNWLKFSQSGGALASSLLDTGDRELVEASPYDRVWGIGFSEGWVRVDEKKGGVDREAWGENLLGKALMRVRERLRERQRERPFSS